MRIPKVWEMLARIRLWPREIEADLHREYRIDVADWHTGAITSRKALVLLDQLSENSGYKTEYERAGNWPIWQQMLKDLHNETALHRAGLYAGGDNAYNPNTYLDPIEMRKHLAEAEEIQEFHTEVESELHGTLGWT